MTTLASEGLSLMGVVHLDLEQGIVVSGSIVDRPGGKFLVGGHERRSDIVRQEIGQRVDVEKLDSIVVANYTASSAGRNLPGRNNLPMVIGVVVRITRDLLAYRYAHGQRQHAGSGSFEG